MLLPGTAVIVHIDNPDICHAVFFGGHYIHDLSRAGLQQDNFATAWVGDYIVHVRNQLRNQGMQRGVFVLFNGGRYQAGAIRITNNRDRNRNANAANQRREEKKEIAALANPAPVLR